MLTSAPPENRSVYVARIDELKREQTQTDMPVQITFSNPPQFTGFFVVVFVFGQVMSQWALLSGHMAAWIAGLIFSLAGISVALYSLIGNLRERDRALRQHLSEINKVVARNQQSRNANGLKSKLDYRQNSDKSKAIA